MTSGAQQLFQRAIAAMQAGALEEAARRLAEVLRQEPNHVAALNVYGILLTQAGRYRDAEEALRQAIVLDARSDATFYNYGIVLKALDRPAEAYDAFSRAIALKPTVAESWNNRGTALNDLRRHREAIADFERAVALNAGYAEAHYNMGRAYAELGEHEQAIRAYDAALRLKPDFADAHANRGSSLYELRRREEALASYQRALSLRPDHGETLHSCGVLYLDLGRHGEALEALDRAYALKPDQKFLPGRRMMARLFACHWAGFEQETARLLNSVREGAAAVSPFDLVALPSTPADQLRCAETYVREELKTADAPAWRGERRAKERLRIAYLSADFHSHATAVLIAELLELHDRSHFEVIGVSFGPDDGSDARRRIVAAFDRFVDVRGKSDVEAARLVAELAPDIAVDLKGHTRDARPGIFAHRPAPIQVSYLGYPGTMGASFIDYIIADATVAPFEEQPHYSEKIVQLPDCYQVNDRKRQIAERTPERHELGLPAEGFVFCCFNNGWKITPPMFDIWMGLLKAVDGSVLWLLQDNELATANLRREAAARGVDPARLVFAGRLPLAEHLARHRRADLFLDTLPYNAHTTASDALWAGLPVLTCRGNTFAGRVAASVLRAAGLPELVTTSLDEYRALAARLARDLVLLRSIKDRLARNRDTCLLFDPVRFARHIESAYRTMWETWRRGEAAKGFRVAPLP